MESLGKLGRSPHNPPKGELFGVCLFKRFEMFNTFKRLRPIQPIQLISRRLKSLLVTGQLDRRHIQYPVSSIQPIQLIQLISRKLKSLLFTSQLNRRHIQYPVSSLSSPAYQKKCPPFRMSISFSKSSFY